MDIFGQIFLLYYAFSAIYMLGVLTESGKNNGLFITVLLTLLSPVLCPFLAGMNSNR